MGPSLAFSGRREGRREGSQEEFGSENRKAPEETSWACFLLRAVQLRGRYRDPSPPTPSSGSLTQDEGLTPRLTVRHQDPAIVTQPSAGHPLQLLPGAVRDDMPAGPRIKGEFK
ncbi:unnamed protein product [Rangifer tarandus platyrhynchus]|uniref:Uncharacterized protein n=1 Tax=Rangifer tarandus platyrhynchus TaxID=3082113 RepID=A0AC59YDW5_RANTA